MVSNFIENNLKEEITASDQSHAINFVNHFLSSTKKDKQQDGILT